MFPDYKENEIDPLIDIVITPTISSNNDNYKGPQVTKRDSYLLSKPVFPSVANIPTPEEFKAVKIILNDPETFNFIPVGFVDLNIFFMMRKKSLSAFFFILNIFVIPIILITYYVTTSNSSTHHEKELVYTLTLITVLIHCFLEYIEVSIVFFLLPSDNIKPTKVQKFFITLIGEYIFMVWIGDIFLLVYMLCVYIQAVLPGLIFGILFCICVFYTRMFLVTYDVVGLVSSKLGLAEKLEIFIYFLLFLILINSIIVATTLTDVLPKETLLLRV